MSLAYDGAARGERRQPRAAGRKANARCVHLGEPTADSVAVTCRCSAGSTTRHYRVYPCALFGETLADYRCTKEAISETMEPRQIEHACRLCDRFATAAVGG